MSRILVASLLLALVVPMSGCAVVMAESIANSDRRAATEDQFYRQLEGDNLVRQQQGLPPLDPCSEKYWFSDDLALKDKPCKERIVHWENGDSTALNPKGMVLARTVPVVPDSVVKYYRKLDKKRPRSYRVYP